MNTDDLKLYAARDKVNGVVPEDICTSWDISMTTLNSWEDDPYFQNCLLHAENCIKRHVPILSPPEIAKVKLGFADL